MLDIPKRLYDALSEEPVTNRVRNNQQLYPSSASVLLDNGQVGGACARATFYRWYKCKKSGKMDPEIQFVCDVGEVLHDLITRMLKNLRRHSNLELLSAEQAFYDSSIFLTGRTDGVLIDNDTGLIHGLEIKTVGDYKSTMVIEQPDIQHILQSVVYLNKYNTNAKQCGTQELENWIILYVARSENWTLKKYPHRSPFKYIWQYTVSLDPVDQHVIITNQAGHDTHYHDISPDKINNRSKYCLNKIKKKELPQRDFKYQYDEVELVALAKIPTIKGGLNKIDTAKVDKWIDKGAPAGELFIDKGDFSCRYCDYVEPCYSDTPEIFDKELTPLINIKKPEISKESPQPNTNNDIF